jgi:hypothetical protein
LDEKTMADWLKEFSNNRTEILKVRRTRVESDRNIEDSKLPPMMDKILNDPRFVAMAIVNGMGASSSDRLPLHSEVLLPIRDERQYDVMLDKILKGLTGMDEVLKQKVRVVLHANKMSPSVSMARGLTGPFMERKRIRSQARRNYERARSIRAE